jgi:hypothetical protein
MGLDRIHGNELAVTHGLLGRMLGVRRAGVSAVIQEFEAAGIIAAGRGRLVIRDRASLAHAACGCHAFIASEYNRLIGDARATSASSPASRVLHAAV